MELLHESMQRWAGQLDAGGVPVKTHLVEVAELRTEKPAEGP
jgi:hypothetical protein